MGTDSFDNSHYLSTDEINSVLNQNKQFNNLFDQLKNADGAFSIDELRVITLGLIDEYILKKILLICCTRHFGMSCPDFLYFFALLNTNSPQAKLQFILDFIFYDKKKIDIDEYISNVNKFLYNSDILLKIFLDERLLKNNEKENEIIKREDVYNFVMNNYFDEFSKYKLYKKKEINYPDNDLISMSDDQNLSSSETLQQIAAQNKTSKLNDDSLLEMHNQLIENNKENNELINNNKNETLEITDVSKNNNNSFTSNNIPKDKENEKNKENSKDKQTTINKQQKQTGQNAILVSKIKLEKNIRNEKLKKAFQKFVKEENGVFPISLFEKMLKEINVIQSLIDIIGNFLRQKSQKTFINFQNFKEILNLIIIPDTNFNMLEEENDKEKKNISKKNDLNGINNEKTKEEIIDGLFTLFAYPNEVIHKKNFFLFAKSTKPQLSSNTIKNWFNQYKIDKFITKQKFKEIIKFILDELYESFEHIKYLPYIFFKFDVKNKKIEKKCIDVLLKNKTLDEYFQEKLQTDEDFYIIDKEFWDKWNLSMNKLINKNYNISPNLVNNLSLNIANELNNINNNNNLNTSIDNLKNNYLNNTNDKSQNILFNSSKQIPNPKAQEQTLKFNIEKIADKDGKLKEGLVYMKDFVVLSKRMFHLFYRWYGNKQDIEIKRSKIYLEDENDIISINKEKEKSKEDNMESNLFPNINSNNNINNNNESSNKISISKIHLNNLEKISLNSTRDNLSLKKGLMKNYSFLKGISKKTHQKFELEIYPVFLAFFNFSDMQKKDSSSLEHIAQSIKENISKSDIKYYPFSRKSKYNDLLQTLQNSLKITLNKNNARLWTYYKNSLELSELNDTLEKNGIVNCATIILEINENNSWPSESLKKEGNNKVKNKNLNLVGLANIGNTCYMNSILQLFLNNAEIKKIFLDKGKEDNKFYEFTINKSKNKNKKMNGELIEEFINLLNEKFIKSKKTITPKKFKEICGEYNSTFKGFEQQDAHDFYTFLVDNLHEETNIKSTKKNFEMKEESDSIDTTELELSNECWANSIRKNASYIYDLFFGQMKSTLTCNECKKIKIKYENFSAVELPIFEGKKIILEIILFRLPFTLSPFYQIENLNSINNYSNKSPKNDNITTKKTTDATNYQNSNSKPTTKNYILNSQNEENNDLINNDNKNVDINFQETKDMKSNLRKKLKQLKISNIGKYADNLCSSLNLEPEMLNVISRDENKMNKIKGGNNNNNNINYNNNDKSQLIEESNLNTAFFERFNKKEDESRIYELINKKNKSKISDNNDIISNPLNLNIPLKLRIEIERNKKTSDIIEILRNMDELKLEKNPQYTEFLVLSKNKYVKLDSVIDETFLNFEQISIYELLNYEGIKKIFGYEDLKEKANILEKQDLQSMLQISEDDEDSIKKNNYNNNDSPKVENKNKNDVKNKKNNEEISEVLVTVFHEYRTLPIDKEDEHLKLFNLTQSSVINNNLDFIILTNKNAIRPVDLYELIWEKYMYYINSPTKYESSLWWKPYSFSSFSSSKDLIKESKEQEKNNINDNNNEILNISSFDYQKHTPFVIKLVKKTTRACIFCPWFRICQGCIINPANKNYLSIPNDCILLVEWRKDVIRKDMKEENINYILNHSSSRKIFETVQDEEEKRNIYDCLDLFTREETIKNIFCEKCNKKTNFKKRLQIDKFPKYLTLILKRFKYTKMFTTKIDNLIHFPLENLDMTNYITPKEGKIKYDLFGVVNHVGTLTAGHYHCDIKQDNSWMKYDDSYTYEYDKRIMTENAYLLTYKLAETKNIYNEVNRHEFKLNLLGLMDTAYKIYLKQYNFKHYFNYVYENNKSDMDGLLEEYMEDCRFYYGEPITVNGKMGFLININKTDDNDKVYIKIKVKKGYYETNVSEKKIIKETVKISEGDNGIEDDEKIKIAENDDKSKVFCGSCLIN